MELLGRQVRLRSAMRRPSSVRKALVFLYNFLYEMVQDRCAETSTNTTKDLMDWLKQQTLPSVLDAFQTVRDRVSHTANNNTERGDHTGCLPRPACTLSTTRRLAHRTATGCFAVSPLPWHPARQSTPQR